MLDKRVWRHGVKPMSGPVDTGKSIGVGDKVVPLYAAPILIVCGLIAGGCDATDPASDGDAVPEIRELREAEDPSRHQTTKGGAVDGREQAVHVRSCDTAIGRLDELPVKGEQGRGTFGPIHIESFDDLTDLAEDQVTPDQEGEVDRLKHPTAVDTSGGTMVWLVVDEGDRDVFALNYHNGSWASRVQEGQHTVGFEVCDRDVNFYNGGFLAAASGCLKLHVYTDEPEGRMVETVKLPFAVESC